MTKSRVDAVVIGRNEGERLISCLRSLVGVIDTLIYVDSGSSDDSVRHAGDLGAHVVQLDTTQSFSAARARNVGYEALKALVPTVEYIQFVDGDCEVVEGWVSAAADFLSSHKTVAVVCGRRREKYPNNSIYNLMMDFEWATPVGEALACGGDCLIRASAFEEVKGYRSSLIAGEEPELCSRLRRRGWAIHRIEAEMTRHDAAMTSFRQYWRRAVRSGYAEAEISMLHFRTGLGWPELRQTIRALLWGMIVPSVVIVGLFIDPRVAFVLLVYPLQITRMAFRLGCLRKESWVYSVLIMLTKFAQIQGIMRLIWYYIADTSVPQIEYKSLP